jgi:3-hydroxyacyl-[acyl-carrier-protein] dehydratase
MNKETLFGLDEILAIIPHRPPFLFVDRVVKFKPDKMIIAERTIRNDEPWFKGHFPQKAIMPGALVLDALAQTSGLLLGFSKKTAPKPEEEPPKIFFLASSQIKFNSPAVPGDIMDLIAESREQFQDLYLYNVEATVGRRTIAKGTLTLAAIEGGI